MGLFFNYDNPVCNEGNTPVVFSYDPSVTSLKELLMYELSQMSYYFVKLNDLGEDVAKINDKIINYITLTVVNLDFRKEQFFSVIKTLYNEVKNLEEKYNELCKKRNIQCEVLQGEKLSFETEAEEILAVNFGEKQSLIKNTVLSKSKKQAAEITTMLVSNACLCITEIENYEGNADEYKSSIPEILYFVNYAEADTEILKQKILDFAEINSKITVKLNNTVKEKYGPTKEQEVNLSIKKGKCILVSGHFYKNLEMILDAVKDTDINVYTHADMLYAHTYKVFQNYPNLVGHYQRSLNNLQLDFSSFPGAIFITKNSHTHIDVIRGTIFTPDNNPAYGISKISENDFSPLKESAESLKGFKRDIEINKITVGYDETKIKNKLQKIIDGLESGKIKHLFVIGLINYNVPQNLYFEEFFDNLPDNTFVISFSYNRKKDNVMHIDSYNDMSAAYIVFEELAKHPEILSRKTTVFLTQCHLQTITYAFNLKVLNVKNIFLGECCPTVINPSLIEGMKNLFDIKQTCGSAKKDIKTILKEG